MKVLVLRFSSIGDIVLTTPVLRGLHLQAGAEVHVLTKHSFAALLQPNPHVARVFSFKKEVNEVMGDLRAERYDWVIDLHHNLRSLRVKLALRRPARAFDKLNLEKWLLVNTGYDLLPDLHIVQRYLATVAHLGVQDDGAGLEHFIPPDQEVQLPHMHPDLRPGQYVAVVLGATHATKRLLPEQMERICASVRHPVVLLGGSSEKEVAGQVVKFCARQMPLDHIQRLVINTCGQLSLHQSASLVRQAGVVLTHDTGLMHIAAAFRKPIVSVWGNTVPKFGMYPLYPEGENRNTTLEVEGLSCRPCSKIGYAYCPKGHFRCIRDIEVADVVAAVEKRMKEVSSTG